jgi:hypothetical protein
MSEVLSQFLRLRFSGHGAALTTRGRKASPTYPMTNDEISTLAVNALMDKIASMVAKGKPNKGLTEDEHAIAMAHVIVELNSLIDPQTHEELDAKKPLTIGKLPVMHAYGVALRAVKNSSQMRQVAEKRKILEVTQKGDKVADVFAQYA